MTEYYSLIEPLQDTDFAEDWCGSVFFQSPVCEYAVTRP